MLSDKVESSTTPGAGCRSMVREFANGAMGHRIDPTWSGPIELFLVPGLYSTTGVTKAVVCAILPKGLCI